MTRADRDQRHQIFKEKGVCVARMNPDWVPSSFLHSTSDLPLPQLLGLLPCAFCKIKKTEDRWNYVFFLKLIKNNRLILEKKTPPFAHRKTLMVTGVTQRAPGPRAMCQQNPRQTCWWLSRSQPLGCKLPEQWAVWTAALALLPWGPHPHPSGGDGGERSYTVTTPTNSGLSRAVLLHRDSSPTSTLPPVGRNRGPLPRSGLFHFSPSSFRCQLEGSRRPRCTPP